MRRIAVVALAAALASLIASCSSDSEDSPSDKSLKKRVEQAFTRVGHADGVHFTLKLTADAPERHVERCILTTVEKKSASPNGLRVAFGYGDSGTCDSLGQVRRAFIDGPVAYIPDEAVPTSSCDAQFSRVKIAAGLRGQLREKIGEPTTSRAQELFTAATDFRAEGNDVVVEIDPDKAAEVLESVDSLPEGSEAEMRIEFDPSGTISSFGTTVDIEDVSVSMVLTISDLGQVQQIVLPNKQCVEPGDDSINSIDEFVDSVVTE